MDNSIFVLPEIEENFVADESMAFPNILSVIISAKEDIYEVICVIGNNSYSLFSVEKFEQDDEIYSLFQSEVTFAYPAYHQETYFVANIDKIGWKESSHFFIDIEPFFSETNFH